MTTDHERGEIARKLQERNRHIDIVTARYYVDAVFDIAALAQPVAAVVDYKSACFQLNESVCQTLGKALGYPWFKDDQKNFPGSTEADGVCVGDHVAESLAEEAAQRIAALRAAQPDEARELLILRVMDFMLNPKTWRCIKALRRDRRSSAFLAAEAEKK